MTLRRDRRRQKKKSPKPSNLGKTPCMNCGEPGPHYAPPGFGSPGFFTCKKREASND